MKRKIIFAWLLGFLGHFAFYDAIQKLSSVPDLYSYGVGILLLRVAFVGLVGRGDDSLRAFDLAAASLGSGVVVGRFTRLIARENGQKSG